MAINPELVERAIVEISKRRANYEYFFDRLSSPEWIAPRVVRKLRWVGASVRRVVGRSHPRLDMKRAALIVRRMAAAGAIAGLACTRPVSISLRSVSFIFP